MASITDKYFLEIRENKPITYEGMDFYPLTVRDYDLYMGARPAFELMQASLKIPKLARLPWCACLMALDEVFREETGKPGRLLNDALLVMAKALRLDAHADAGRGNQMVYPVRTVLQKGELTAILIGNPPRFATLDMRKMNDVRKIIAAQNGYEIPDETWNPDLVRASRENAMGRGDSNIDVNFETLVYSVAYHCHTTPAEIYDWTIRDFQGMQNAIDRSLGFQIFSLAEAAGYSKFPKGRPFPTWKYDEKRNMPTGFRTIADIDAGAKGLIKGA